jgi:hypothetical protein
MWCLPLFLLFAIPVVLKLFRAAAQPAHSFRSAGNLAVHYDTTVSPVFALHAH